MKVGEFLDIVRDETAVRIYAYAWSTGCDAGNDMEFTGDVSKGAFKTYDTKVMTILRELHIEYVSAGPKHNIDVFVRLNYNDFEKLGNSISGVTFA